MEKLIWTTPVWGRKYLDYMRSTHIPSLMAPGNFPALQHPIDTIIYTTAAEAAEVGDIVQPMSRFGRLQVLAIQDWPLSHPWPAMRGAMVDVVRRAWEADAGLLYTVPDTVVGDGSYATVASEIARGSRACMAQAIAADEAPMIRALNTRRRNDRATIEMSRVDLIELGLRHLHPFTRSYEWDSPNFNTVPTAIHWVIDNCRVMHAFHVHPAFVYPRRLATDFRWTIDADFMELTAISREEITFFKRADDFAMVELLSPSTKSESIDIANTASIGRIAEWAARYATPLNRWFFSQRTVLSGDADRPQPNIDAIVRAILDGAADISRH